MRIRIRNPDTVVPSRVTFPPCEKWLKEHQGEEYTILPENHVHIMHKEKRRTIPIEFVEVLV